jgi:hypothetical protein
MIDKFIPFKQITPYEYDIVQKISEIMEGNCNNWTNSEWEVTK